MKATCPSCGTKAAHEKSTAVLRVWFRCGHCGHVWRGTLLSLAYEGTPPGSPRGTLEPTEQEPIQSIAPRELLDQAELDSHLADVEDALDSSVQPKTDPKPAPSEGTAQEPTRAAGAGASESRRDATPGPRRDVTTWLDGAEREIENRPRPQRPVEVSGSTEVDAPPPTSAPSPARRTSVDSWLSGNEAALADRRPHEADAAPSPAGGQAPPGPSAEPPPAAARQHVETAEMRQDLDQFGAAPSPERTEMRQDVAEVTASPSPRQADERRNVDRVATPPVHQAARGERSPTPKVTPASTAGGRTSVADSLRRLEVFDAELTHMQQRLDRTDGSYGTVVKRWQPPLPDDQPIRAATEQDPSDDGPDGS